MEKGHLKDQTGPCANLYRKAQCEDREVSTLQDVPPCSIPENLVMSTTESSYISQYRLTLPLSSEIAIKAKYYLIHCSEINCHQASQKVLLWNYKESLIQLGNSLLSLESNRS